MDRQPFRMLAIAGSLRQGSYNRELLRAAEEEDENRRLKEPLTPVQIT